MWARRGLIADHEGALQVIEALTGIVLMLSTLACVSVMPGSSAEGNTNDLRLMSSDLLYVLQQREGQDQHPGLAPALSTPDGWEQLSPELEADLRSYLPAGYRALMRTPYGDIGDDPPDGRPMYARPFIAYREDTAQIIDCSLIVWRL